MFLISIWIQSVNSVQILTSIFGIFHLVKLDVKKNFLLILKLAQDLETLVNVGVASTLVGDHIDGSLDLLVGLNRVVHLVEQEMLGDTLVFESQVERIWLRHHLILHLNVWVLHHARRELLTVLILGSSIGEHHHLHILHVGVRVHASWESHLLRHHHPWELTHLLHVLLSHVELRVLLHHVLGVVLHACILRIHAFVIMLSQFVLTMGKHTALTKLARSVLLPKLAFDSFVIL